MLQGGSSKPTNGWWKIVRNTDLWPFLRKSDQTAAASNEAGWFSRVQRPRGKRLMPPGPLNRSDNTCLTTSLMCSLLPKGLRRKKNQTPPKKHEFDLMEFPVSYLKPLYSQEDISGFNRQEPVGRPSILGFKFHFISLIVQEMFPLSLQLLNYLSKCFFPPYQTSLTSCWGKTAQYTVALKYMVALKGVIISSFSQFNA